eukprot:232012_1
MASNVNELLQRVEQVFGSSCACTLGEYFIHHEFDAWKDIVEDIDTSYDDCCCKTALFEQLKISDITQKLNEYSRLKQCLYGHLPSKCVLRITQALKEYFDGPIATIISQSFASVVNEEQFEELEAIQDDMEDIDNSVILMFIMDQIRAHKQAVPSNIKMIATQIQSIVTNNNAEPQNRVEQSLIDVLLPLIKATLVKPLTSR